MPTDPFGDFSSNLTAPARTHFAITPSDTTDLAVLPRALVCTVSGTVVIRDAGGVDISYPVSAGQEVPFRAHRVLATGTTATMVGWY